MFSARTQRSPNKITGHTLVSLAIKQTGNINNKLNHFKNAINLDNHQNCSSQFEITRVSLKMLNIFIHLLQRDFWGMVRILSPLFLKISINGLPGPLVPRWVWPKGHSSLVRDGCKGGQWNRKYLLPWLSLPGHRPPIIAFLLKTTASGGFPVL